MISIHHFTTGANKILLCVEDHGKGMDKNGLQHFATFGRSAERRNQRKTNIDDPSYLEGSIGEYGVGLKQAAFWSGEAIACMTAQSDKNTVLEFGMSVAAFKEAEEKGQDVYQAPVFERQRGKVDQCQLSSLITRPVVQQMIRDEVEKRDELKHFTRIIISDIDDDQAKLMKNEPHIREIMCELIRIYQFYFYGNSGLPSLIESDTLAAQSAKLTSDQSILPSVLRLGLNVYSDGVLKYGCVDLSRYVLEPNVLSSCVMLDLKNRRGQPFKFKSILTDVDTAQQATFTGVIHYYPYIEGRETQPEMIERYEEEEETMGRQTAAMETETGTEMEIDQETNDTTAAVSSAAASASSSSSSAAASASSSSSSSSSSRPVVSSASLASPLTSPPIIFECAWEGRVIPETRVKTLKWIEEAIKKAKLPDCRNRIKGQLTHSQIHRQT